MTKVMWAERLKVWRAKNAEFYARQLLAEPKKSSLVQVLPRPGVVLVLGGRRYGKTGVAHEAASKLHDKYGMPAACHLDGASDKLRKDIQRQLPSWLRVTTDRSQWPDGGVVIYDEVAQSHHARRTQSSAAVDLEDLIGISGQRNQVIFFLSHHTLKIDPNIVRDIDMMLYKRPLISHAIWERDELTDLTWRAVEFFRGFPTELAQKRATLAIDFRSFEFSMFNNGLPLWWSDRLSRLFKEVKQGGANERATVKFMVRGNETEGGRQSWRQWSR